MTDTHWFDRWNLALTCDSRRRAIFRAAGMLVAGHFLGDAKPSEGKGKKKRRKGHRGKHKRDKDKGGNKPPKPPDNSEIPGICYKAWPFAEEAEDREWCKIVWEQCPPGGDEQFCIVKDDPFGHKKHAACCDTGEDCCGGVCRDNWSDSLNCGGCDRRCSLYETCVAGNCRCNLDLYDECPDAGCVNTLRDPHNCGACGNECPFWTVCINGECKCAPDRKGCDLPNLPLPACIRQTDICCGHTVCSGGVCCIHPSGVALCLSEECPVGWETRRA